MEEHKTAVGPRRRRPPLGATASRARNRFEEALSLLENMNRQLKDVFAASEPENAILRKLLRDLEKDTRHASSLLRSVSVLAIWPTKSSAKSQADAIFQDAPEVDRDKPTESAKKALADFRKSHAHLYEGLEGYRAGQAARSERALQYRIDHGELVSVSDLAHAWNRSRQSLEQACERGDLFRVYVGGRWWYPAAFMQLNAANVAQVCQALAGGDDISKLLFWEEHHGALGGRTIAEALRAGLVARAVEIARAEALENGWLEADASQA